MKLKNRNFYGGVIAGFLIAIIINNLLSNTAFAFRSELSPNNKIGHIFSILDKAYVNDYDKDKLQDTMYSGLMNGLGDPYSSYMNPKTFETFMQQTDGSYVGIGIVLSIDKNDKRLIVVSPYEKSPAAQAGILPGDKIIAINKTTVCIDNYEEALSMLKGTANTKVTLKILRNNQEFDVDVMRMKIDIPTVSSKMLENNIGYLRITTFDRLTYNQFMTACNDLRKNNMKKLIIDLRNNPGGLLNSVVQITDELVPHGCIVYTENKSGKKEYSYADDKYLNIPLIILVNGNSASASEVLSGAVKDLKVGKLVGERTFGKGLVQNLFPLPDKSAIKVTIAKYYTPSGVCIDGKGIAPDYEVPMSENVIPTSDDDIQLKKAIELLGA